MKNKILIGVSVIMLILLFANPTPYDFQSFVGKPGKSVLRRTNNWFVFSIYQINQKRYLGILKNFFALDNYSQSGLIGRERFVQDSLKVADSLSLIQFGK